MMTVLVDTNVLISFLERSSDNVPSALAAYDELIVTPTVLGEFRAGIGSDKRGRQSEAALETFLAMDSVREIGMTSKTAVYYGKIYRVLKQLGKPIPVNDIWIAATALENAVELCTFDAHFEHIPMLQLRRL